MVSWVEPISRLNERKRGFALVKEKFGLDIPYKFSELWSNEYKKVINTLGIEDVNNIEEGVPGNDNNVRDNSDEANNRRGKRDQMLRQSDYDR